MRSILSFVVVLIASVVSGCQTSSTESTAGNSVDFTGGQGGSMTTVVPSESDSVVTPCESRALAVTAGNGGSTTIEVPSGSRVEMAQHGAKPDGTGQTVPTSPALTNAD